VLHLGIAYTVYICVSYAKRFPTILTQIIKDAEHKVGILVVANIAYEISDLGALEITRSVIYRERSWISWAHISIL
jgi:hypothetical protein